MEELPWGVARGRITHVVASARSRRWFESGDGVNFSGPAGRRDELTEFPIFGFSREIDIEKITICSLKEILG